MTVVLDEARLMYSMQAVAKLCHLGALEETKHNACIVRDDLCVFCIHVLAVRRPVKVINVRSGKLVKLEDGVDVVVDSRRDQREDERVECTE